MFNEIGWSGRYEAVIEDQKIIQMTYKAIIKNTAETIADVSEIILISGQPYRQSMPQDMLRSAAFVHQESSANIEPETLDEYQKYVLNNQTQETVKFPLDLSKETGLILFTRLPEFQTKYYEYDFSGSKVSHGYLIKSEQILPAGEFIALSSTNEFLGKDQLDQRPAGLLTRILLGVTSKISIESTIESLDKPSENGEMIYGKEVNISCKFINNYTDSRTIHLKTLTHGWHIVSINFNNNSVKDSITLANGFIYLPIELPPGSGNFTLQIVLQIQK